jgi:hypothetical protein
MNRYTVLLENERRILTSVKKLIREVIINEGDTSGSTDAENILAILMSNQSMTKEEFTQFYETKDTNALFLKNYFARFLTGKPVDVYYGAIVEIKKQKLPSDAKQVGDSNFSTTEAWRSYGGISSVRSKADVIGQNITFSVKNASTKVRVLDASAPQIIALIHCSMDKTKQTEKVKEIIRKSMKTIKELSNEEGARLSRTYKDKKYGLGELRKVIDTAMQKLIVEYDKNTKELNDEVVKLFSEVQSDVEFKKSFIYESLSGKTMLGESSDGRADSIITWTSDFSKIKKHDIQDVTDTIISTFTIPKFGSKSSGFTITKTIQLFFKEGLNKLDKLVEHEEKLFKHRNSKLITEGAFADLWNGLQEKGMTVIKKLIDAILNFVNSVTAKLSGPITKILSFVGFEIQVLGDYSLDANSTYASL